MKASFPTLRVGKEAFATSRIRTNRTFTPDYVLYGQFEDL
ncbi:hypothetical protein SAMN04489731_102260 [Amycolatopsis regifaucium]|nr:hypothetical protein SAMN04489731_102260 [Amycolatopsis regifaucium]